MSSCSHCDCNDLVFVPNTEAGRAFREAMRGRHYGQDAATDAWAWFKQGWQDKGKLSEVSETDQKKRRDAMRDLQDSVVERYRERAGSLLCEHANEVPSWCPCASNCFCRANTCKEPL
jgi:hypothetical protein